MLQTIIYLPCSRGIWLWYQWPVKSCMLKATDVILWDLAMPQGCLLEWSYFSIKTSRVAEQNSKYYCEGQSLGCRWLLPKSGQQWRASIFSDLLAWELFNILFVAGKLRRHYSPLMLLLWLCYFLWKSEHYISSGMWKAMYVLFMPGNISPMRTNIKGNCQTWPKVNLITATLVHDE